MKEVNKYVLKAEVSGRVDLYVSLTLKDKSISRSLAKKLIQQGFIKVNNERVKPSYQLKLGDVIHVEVPLEEDLKVEPENIPLNIVYEDRDCLVVNKQAGVVVHPAINHSKGTLVNALLYFLNKGVTKEIRPGIVHRLDKDTSGLMVVAKTDSAETDLKKQFKNRTIKKAYLCLVEGFFRNKTGLIDRPIGRHPKNRQKFSVLSSTLRSKEAQTDYKVLEEIDKLSLLEVRPLTGRTHQIRVHLSSIGHPIVGDKIYGGKRLIDRQFLHASLLGFKQPRTSRWLEFKSDLPSELKNFLKRLKG